MAFFGQHFVSFEDFKSKFEAFKEENFVAFKTKSSETIEKANKKTISQIPAQFVYSRVEYVCTHYGQPRYRGTGVKSKTKHSATGCEAYFVLKYNYYEKCLSISKWHTVHNHPTTRETYAQEYQVKRLKPHEKSALKEIVELNPKNENLLLMVNKKYNKAFTLAEIRRFKHQLKSGRGKDDMLSLLDSLEGLQEQGQVKIVLSDNGTDTLLDIVAFATAPMTTLFQRYPEVIYMDGTYKSNKCGFPLYQIMVEDGNGRGRTVFYAFIRQENADILNKMVGVFVDFMGESVSRTTHAMTDKDPNEINAIRNNLPNVSPLLCAFHVHKAMKAKVHKLQCSKEVKDRLQQLAYVLVTTNDTATFQQQVLAIQSVNETFYEYISSNWLNCVEAWAYHARLYSRLFFNDTNNKCEGENRRLKEILCSNTSLAEAIKKLFQHSVTQQLDVSSASVVQSTSSVHFRDANPRWHHIYALFSSHAVQLMIQDHVSCPVEVVVVENSFDCTDASGVLFRVSGRPLLCPCPFYSQTSLPCCHIMSIFSEATDISETDLFAPNNRWLKANVLDDAYLPCVAPVDVYSIVGPEARHHRTEAVLARLSSLLKQCGSAQFQDRISKVESLVETWEGGLDCVVVTVTGADEVVGEVAGGGVRWMRL